MTEEVIYYNKYYEVKLGKSAHSDKDIDVYQIWNKKYGIVESESSVLPMACSNANDFADAWEELDPDNIPGEDGNRVLTLN